MANKSLGAARKKKNDEFYTMYHDIEREMVAYWNFNKDVFRDKVVLCPADDPEWSNFRKFFADVFEEWGLKKADLYQLCPAIEPKMRCSLWTLPKSRMIPSTTQSCPMNVGASWYWSVKISTVTVGSTVPT